MTAASVRRVFGTVKAITKLAVREYGLACPNVFANVFIPDDEKASTRLPIPDDNLVAIQKECVELDDDVRWLVALISDTGMRLAEAVPPVLVEHTTGNQVALHLSKLPADPPSLGRVCQTFFQLELVNWP